MLPNASLASIINEEISLEGLEGSTLEALWNHIAVRLRMAVPLPQKLMGIVWTQILRNSEFEFFLLLTERKPFAHFNRLGNIDVETGIAVQPSIYPGHRFVYRLVEENGIRGSCEEYETRTAIPRAELLKISFIEAERRYGRKFVIVASQRMRESFLILPNCTAELSGMQYCLLEWIGRSRFNGETSHGKHSLVEVSGDSSSLFYNRKVLSNAKLITRQNLSIRVDDMSIQGMVFHLPRYYTEMKTKQLIIVERVVNELKQRKNYMADYEEIKLMMLNKSDAGKLFRSPEFLRFIKTDELVPFRTLYPNAPQNVWMSKRGEEKVVRVMRLIDPSVDVYEAWGRDAAEEGVVESKDGFLAAADSNVLYADIPLLQLAYNVISHNAGRGTSQSELALSLGLDKLNARGVVKNLTKLKYIESIAVDEGRQRTSKFFIVGCSMRAALFEKEMSQYVSNQLNVIETQQRQQHSIMKTEASQELGNATVESSADLSLLENDSTLFGDADNSSVSLSNTNERTVCDNSIHDNIAADVVLTDKLLIKKAPTGISNAMQSKSVSELMLRRCNFIIQLVKREEAIEPRTIQKRLKVAEQASGSLHTACNKSVMRLIARLAADRLVLIANVTLTHEEREFKLVFVCDPKITVDHPGLQSKLTMAKSRIVLQGKPTATVTASSVQEAAREVSAEEPRGYPGAFPKCPRMKLYHEYMYYLVYGLPRDARELRADNLTSIDLGGLNATELAPIYSDTNDWRMFIPPLNVYDGYGTGWVLLTDVVVCMPLFVFCSIFTFSFYTTALDYYLEHPVRRYVLLKDLPDPIRLQLLHKRRYVVSMLELTKLLCYAGLIQMGPQTRKTRDQTYIYLNQHACLLDTTSSKDGYNEIEERPYQLLRFHFDTLDNVQEYWDRLYDVVISTRLNARNTAIGREVLVQQLHSKPALVESLLVQTVQSVSLKDHPDQLPPGDGKGAAGFDTAMFMHLKTNWQKMVNPVGRRIDKHRLKLVRRSIKLKKKQITTGSGIQSSADHMPSTVGGGSGSSNMPVLKLGRKKHIKKRIIIPRKLAPRLWRETYDEVDKRALKLMDKQRVKWTRAEDHILILCRVGQLYLYGPLQSISCPVNSSTIRDVLHWANVRSSCKTSRACQRRVLYMTKKLPGVADLIRTCLEETKQNAQISERFGAGFVKKLRERFVSVEEYMVASRIHYVQLVHMIRQTCSKLVRGADATRSTVARKTRGEGNVRRSAHHIPNTLEELYGKYIVTETHNTPKVLNYAKDPSTIQELQMLKLTILMHSAVTHGRTPAQLHNVYREYSESILTGAMRLMRSYHLVSLNKRLRGIGTKLLTASKSASGDRELYHVSIHYQQQLMTSLSFELFLPMFEQYMHLLDRPRYDEMYACDDDAQGLVLLLSELLATGRVEVQIDQEANYIEVRSDTKEPVPFYSDVLAGLPSQQDQPSGASNSTSSGTTTPTTTNRKKAAASVTFKTPTDKGKPHKLHFSSLNDSTFLYVAHPVERLLKVPIEYFHSFCLLEQLQHSDRRLMVQTFKIDETHPVSCSLPNCVVMAGTKAGGNSRSSDLVARCLALMQGRREQLARIRQHGSMDRSQRKNRVDASMMLDVREDNLLQFFGKYIADFQKRWSEKQKRDFNRHNQTSQSLAKTTVNMVELVEECLGFDDKFPEYNWLDRYETSNAPVDDAEDAGDGDGADERAHDMLTALSEKVFKLHNFYEVTTMKVHIRMKIPAGIISQTLVDDRDPYGHYSVPRCFLSDGAKRRREILVRLTSDVLWPEMQQLERHLLEAMALIERNSHANTLLAYIECKQILGASVLELANTFPNHAQLKQHLNALCNFKLLLRTGYRTVTYVHWRYAEEWLTKAPIPDTKEKFDEQQPSGSSSTGPGKRKGPSLTEQDHQVVKKARGNTADEMSTESMEPKYSGKYMLLAMAPWVKIDGMINKRMLFRWLTSILLYCVAHPGVPLDVLFVRFNMMAPFHLRQLLEILQDYGCVSLHSMECTMKKTIFSVFTPASIVPPSEFVPDEQTYVEVLPDALSTLTLCIGENRKYAQGFYDPSRKKHVIEI
uniref:Uncharacterized protein n=1 Tax=Anopheles farauti TaxID=69004 RepID=A0A182Q4G9_9DIPT